MKWLDIIDNIINKIPLFLNNINLAMDFLIKLAALVGIFYVVKKYLRILNIDKEIDKISNNFNQIIRDARHPGHIGLIHEIQDEIMGNTEYYTKERDLDIESLKRERDNIISTIPFLK